MIFILEDKIYNTDNAKEVLNYKKSCPVNSLFGTMYFWHKAILYRTKKGNWFTVATGDYDRKTAYIESDESVKQIFKDLNEVDLYNKYFVKLEEA